jgi:molybdopterin molybdotransferase
VRLLRAASPGRYIARRGAEVAGGQVVLERGATLGPAGLAVAASVGADRLSVYAPPRVGVLATGDELVAISASPEAAQIRNSNSPMLVALLKRLGCSVSDLGVVRDDPRLIRDAVADALARFNVLFITGGMSMGTHDHVPRTLIDLGVEPRITKLRIKPGKPFVFGVKEGSAFGVQGSAGEKGAGAMGGGPAEDAMPTGQSRAADSSLPTASRQRPTPPTTDHRPLATAYRYVFGLPGNPVSGFVCTLRLASRLIARLRGETPREKWIDASLSEALPANGPREFYQPVFLSGDGAARPLKWKGSADVFTLAAANGLLARAANEPALAGGQRVRVLEV